MLSAFPSHLLDAFSSHLFHFASNGLIFLQYQPAGHASVKPCIVNAPAQKILLVADSVQISSPNLNMSNNEEADTCQILNSMQTHAENIVVTAYDIDVLVLLVIHYPEQKS